MHSRAGELIWVSVIPASGAGMMHLRPIPLSVQPPSTPTTANTSRALIRSAPGKERQPIVHAEAYKSSAASGAFFLEFPSVASYALPSSEDRPSRSGTDPVAGGRKGNDGSHGPS